MWVKGETKFSSFVEFICQGLVINHRYAIYMLLPTNMVVHTNRVAYHPV